MSLSAVFGLDRILRRTRQFFSSAMTPLTRPAAAGVGGVHVLLELGELPEPAGVGVLAPTPLRDRDRRAGALIVLGLCRGELLGLRWCDVDMDAATFHVRQTVQRVGGELVVGGTKTCASSAVVPLPKITRSVILARRRVWADERKIVWECWQVSLTPDAGHVA